MSSYFIALIDIHDPDKYERYLTGYDDVFNKFEGKVIVVEDHPRVLEGSWPSGRTILIKPPNDRALREWYESKDYQRIVYLCANDSELIARTLTLRSKMRYCSFQYQEV